MNGSVFGAVKTSGELSAVIMPPTFMESVEEKNFVFIDLTVLQSVSGGPDDLKASQSPGDW